MQTAKKTIQIAAILILTLFLEQALIAQVNYFSIGSVSKISSTKGNFFATLDPNDGFGNHIDTVGDLNNDGITDLVVGAPWDDDGGTDHGAVYILFMDSNGTVDHYQKISDTQGNFGGSFYPSELFGSAVACIGDVSGDGINDIAVGAIYDQDGAYWNGAVWIIHLDTNGMAKGYSKISATQGNFTGVLTPTATFGIDVCPLGDFNNDGTIDLLVGSSRQNDGNTRNGALWILLMDTGGYVKSHRKISQTSGNLNVVLDYEDFFGHGATNLGDINGDGVTDIAVTASQDDDGGTDRGAIYILMLDTSGHVIQKKKISSLTPTFTGMLSNGDIFGHRIDPLPDLDGDGIPELLASAIRDDDGGTDRGAFYILYLDSTGSLKYHQKISATQGNFPDTIGLGSRFGFIANIGDFNRDGFIEIAVGANADSDGGSPRGAVWILKGPVLTPPFGLLPHENSAICLGDSTLIQANCGGGSLPYQYNWSNGLSNQPQHFVSPSTTTMYYITITDATNNLLKDSILVEVHPIPTVNLGPDTSVFFADTIKFSAGQHFMYLWSDSSTTPTISVCGTDIGLGYHTIYVTVWNSSGCIGSDTLILYFHDGNSIIEVSELTVEIFPIPSTNMINVLVMSQSQIRFRASLYDLQGRCISQGSELFYEKTSIDLGSLRSGAYLLIIKDEFGNWAFQKIIQKM